MNHWNTQNSIEDHIAVGIPLKKGDVIAFVPMTHSAGKGKIKIHEKLFLKIEKLKQHRIL